MKKITKRYIGLVIVLFAVVIGGSTLEQAVYYNSDVEIPTILTPQVTEASTLSVGKPAATATVASIKQSTSRLPARLEIPALSINAKVQSVGINTKGNMGTPNNFTDVAWYKGGTVPGDQGSAVIDGHVDNGLALAGVFKHLNEIAVGDDVYVTADNGTRTHFQVIKIESYPYLNVPVADIFNAKDGAYLNLVTCIGNWIQDGKTYDERLVVYTKLVS